MAQLHVDASQCDGMIRPSEMRDCTATVGCTWHVGEWGPCSARTCGISGSRTREVLCASLAADTLSCGSQEAGTRPSAVQQCIGGNLDGLGVAGASVDIVNNKSESDLCSWRTSQWSTCDASCGWGHMSRDVYCSAAAGCAGEKPEDKRPCYSSVGCGWQLGLWSECSATCGAGTRSRQVTCKAGAGACATLEQPSVVSSCYTTAGCRWKVMPWSECSTRCGNGVQARQIMCSSGRDEDCSAEPRPLDQQECRNTQGCGWTLSAWSLCTAERGCGAGTQWRHARCASGADVDCRDHPRPPVLRSCVMTKACTWQVSAWSACSALCGVGTRSRTVWCPGVEDAHCFGSRPDGVQQCVARDGCHWTVSAWSPCSSDCGVGVQRREASCNEERCEGAGPPLAQPCHVQAGCKWKLQSAWGDCSSRCGVGIRLREVVCSGNGSAKCESERPPDAEECAETAGCKWRTSPWSACTSSVGATTNTTLDCGPKTREVDCPQQRGCSGQVPVSVAPCGEAHCAAISAEGTELFVSLSTSLGIDDDASGVLIAVRAAAARAANLHVNAVAVSVFERNSTINSTEKEQGSRRMQRILQLRVIITGTTLAATALLTSDAGLTLFGSLVKAELAVRGVDALLVGVRPATGPLTQPALPISEVAPLLPPEVGRSNSDNGGPSIALVGVGSVLVAVLGGIIGAAALYRLLGKKFGLGLARERISASVTRFTNGDASGLTQALQDSAVWRVAPDGVGAAPRRGRSAVAAAPHPFCPEVGEAAVVDEAEGWEREEARAADSLQALRPRWTSPPPSPVAFATPEASPMPSPIAAFTPGVSPVVSPAVGAQRSLGTGCFTSSPAPATSGCLQRSSVPPRFPAAPSAACGTPEAPLEQAPLLPPLPSMGMVRRSSNGTGSVTTLPPALPVLTQPPDDDDSGKDATTFAAAMPCVAPSAVAATCPGASLPCEASERRCCGDAHHGKAVLHAEDEEPALILAEETAGPLSARPLSSRSSPPASGSSSSSEEDSESESGSDSEGDDSSSDGSSDSASGSDDEDEGGSPYVVCAEDL
eukprot:TRINITY_DN22122_c0_g1_i2.p2 TRINITY_DN22122_c0_g1~~TRINITY_DN22122_c0_g1_i2.p2  ORF type:complete len:1054 (-),score=154.00 TRINITY_DN22122_c0_g1_i2:109-3270(-)